MVTPQGAPAHRRVPPPMIWSPVLINSQDNLLQICQSFLSCVILLLRLFVRLFEAALSWRLKLARTADEPVSEKYQTQSSLKNSCLPGEMTQWVKKALDVKVSGPELDPQNPHKRSDTSNNETAGRNYWLSGVHWPPSQTYLAMFHVNERYYGNQKVEGTQRTMLRVVL